MSTQDFITELFCRVDDVMQDLPKHSQSSLYPSEVVTLGLLFAIKGVGNRAFYRWIKRDHLSLFPHLPERTRLFRLFAAAAPLLIESGLLVSWLSLLYLEHATPMVSS